jgi:hypothetical protein
LTASSDRARAKISGRLATVTQAQIVSGRVLARVADLPGCKLRPTLEFKYRARMEARLSDLPSASAGRMYCGPCSERRRIRTGIRRKNNRRSLQLLPVKTTSRWQDSYWTLERMRMPKTMVADQR